MGDVCFATLFSSCWCCCSCSCCLHLQRRNGSTASFNASVAAWGSLIFQSQKKQSTSRYIMKYARRSRRGSWFHDQHAACSHARVCTVLHASFVAPWTVYVLANCYLLAFLSLMDLLSLFCSVLDFWAKGSGLTSVAIFVRDGSSRSESK